MSKEEEAKNRASLEYINKFSKLANECVMTKFCHGCFEEYSLHNPKYLDYQVCRLCACKIHISIQAEVVASVMKGR